jgi:hypothetical protein
MHAPTDDAVVATAAASTTLLDMRSSSTLIVGYPVAFAAAPPFRGPRRALGMQRKPVLDAPRLRLALLRGDRDRAGELLHWIEANQSWYLRRRGTSPATLIPRLDAHAILGHRAKSNGPPRASRYRARSSSHSRCAHWDSCGATAGCSIGRPPASASSPSNDTPNRRDRARSQHRKHLEPTAQVPDPREAMRIWGGAAPAA